MAKEIERLEARYRSESDVMKRLRNWQGKIYEAKTTAGFFRAIEEKVCEFSEQESVKELTEEEIKQLEKEVAGEED